MKIDLTWINRNTDDEGTRIYRSSSPLDPNNLPQPIAVMGPGAVSYTDTDVVRNQLYYYRMEVFKGNDYAITKDVAISTIVDTGPGNKTLIAGDYHCGYFGRVPESDLFNNEELCYFLNFYNGSPRYLPNEWLKYSFRGKILYFPKVTVRFSVTWDQLYAAGLVFGDGVGYNLPNGYSTPQDTRVSRDGNTFKVRLITGSPTNPYPSINSPHFPTVYSGSEWNELLLRTTEYTFTPQNDGKWDLIPTGDMFTNLEGINQILCQEISVSKGNVLVRGRTVSSTHFAGYAEDVTFSTKAQWRPVLELIPQ